jgi:hypothetical protein
MKKMMKEAKTGEMYSSKKAMMMHEKGEGMKEMSKEYGKKAAMKKAMKKKVMSKKTMMKKK